MCAFLYFLFSPNEPVEKLQNIIFVLFPEFFLPLPIARLSLVGHLRGRFLCIIRPVLLADFFYRLNVEISRSIEIGRIFFAIF